jgi:hypothetical protein
VQHFLSKEKEFGMQRRHSESSFICLWQVAAEVAAPLSQVKKITMVIDGTGEIGAGRITGEVTDRQF